MKNLKNRTLTDEQREDVLFWASQHSQTAESEYEGYVADTTISNIKIALTNALNHIESGSPSFITGSDLMHESLDNSQRNFKKTGSYL